MTCASRTEIAYTDYRGVIRRKEPMEITDMNAVFLCSDESRLVFVCFVFTVCYATWVADTAFALPFCTYWRKRTMGSKLYLII